ncbi:MAG: hypothetical protein WCY84_00495 [Candidatus Cloacimonadaceae bacterium]
MYQPNIRNSSLYLVIFLWGLVPALWGLIPGSAFVPEVRSVYESSLLSANPEYEAEPDTPLPEGLGHPFRNYQIFKEHFCEALSFGDIERHLVSYQDSPSRFKAVVNVLAGYEYKAQSDTDYGFWYKGWNFYARQGERLKLKSRWYNGAYFGDLDAAETDELIDGYFKRSLSRIQLDNLSGSLSYGSDAYTLALGRGRFQIAPSISGSIILNDRVNDYGYILAEGKVGDFSLSFLHGSLMADSTYKAFDNPILNDRHYPDKYIAVHLLNYRPSQIWELYAGESVVYGNRSIDINYLLPNSFWRAVEHNQWDRDNVLIFTGFMHRPKPGFRFYGQLAIDEFSYGKIFTNWWGNKYALQGGWNYEHTLGSAGLEITAIRPYTYGHFMAHTTYSHDGRLLGYPEGANLLNISFENQLKAGSYIDWVLKAGYSYQGSEGADWHINYHDVFAGQISSAEVKWFAGDKNHIYSLANALKIPIFAHHQLLIGQQSKYQDEWDHRFFGAWQFWF